jgi:hypothetical protein
MRTKAYESTSMQGQRIHIVWLYVGNVRLGIDMCGSPREMCAFRTARSKNNRSIEFFFAIEAWRVCIVFPHASLSRLGRRLFTAQACSVAVCDHGPKNERTGNIAREEVKINTLLYPRSLVCAPSFHCLSVRMYAWFLLANSGEDLNRHRRMRANRSRSTVHALG